MSRLRVLLIEDDARLAAFTREFLEANDVCCLVAPDGVIAEQELLRGAFDCVVLDVMLPLRDGYEVCRRLRARSDVPIIMTTARTTEADRIIGLELGADDYVPKPFSVRELLARVRANVRRARGQVGPRSDRLEVGPLVLHLDAMTATLAGRALTLTSYEFSLLRVLAERRGTVIGREQLLELARGTAEESFDRSIDVRISRLRAKLGDDPRRPALLRTVRGVGYMLCEDPT
ncbi:MAG: response regulator transcription factor [Myxococcaceae bacterium]|nr:response regulator transcription factor [Myxococcaceae bacterium]